MNQTMGKLKKMREDEYSSFLRVLFGLGSPTPLPAGLQNPETGAGTIEWIDTNLNDSQKNAIAFALASREIALIHGPPGVSDILYCNISANSDTDWQDPYLDRTYPADAQARSKSIGMWTEQYLC